MGRTGRPKIDINWNEFEKLCELQCTAEEVAYWFRCSVDTIERTVKKKYKTTFAEVMRQNGSKGKIALRRGLFSLALKGNLGALIWLSKNHLGMSEKVETKNENNTTEVKKMEFRVEWADEGDDGSVNQNEAENTAPEADKSVSVPV